VSMPMLRVGKEGWTARGCDRGEGPEGAFRIRLWSHLATSRLRRRYEPLLQ
jgi:hypothetical protein